MAAVAALAAAPGCGPVEPIERAGIRLTPPDTWRRFDPPAGRIPGVPLAAWAGPSGSTLVVYRTLPAPGGSPAVIAEALANRLTNLQDLRVVVKRTETVGKTIAARVEVVGPGTGDAIAPTGSGKAVAPAGRPLVPTREITVGFDRPEANFFLSWDTPESAYDQIAADIKATLQSLEFTSGGGPSFHRY